jgi:hypothetical protein
MDGLMADVNLIPREPRKAGHLARFSVEVCNARTGEEKTHHWVTKAQIIATLHQMREGDALVINHVGYAEEGAIYPEQE